LKLLKESVASDESSVQRFINESKAVAMLSHPNIVRIYDVSMRDHYKYIVMEYIEGMTLKTYMDEKGQIPYEEAIGYTEQILAALGHAHEKGIVHRDIKPQNIMLLRDGQIKVTDFGIAKLPNAETVTMTDKAIGTVYYISPEQASGKPIDNRSDFYSLGVMMYEMLGGRLPFTADNPVTVAMMQITASPAPLSTLNANIPKGLEQIVSRAMAKDPDDRYQNAAEMLHVIEALKSNPRVTFKKSRILAPLKKKKKGKEHNGKQNHSMFPIILGVVIPFMAVAIICGIVLMQRLTVQGPKDEYREIQVPNFVNRYYSSEIADFLSTSDIYEIESITYAYNADVEAGYVIEQTPNAGSTKKVLSGVQKCAISLVISTGAETVAVPNYVMMDYRLVKSAITREGLQFRVVWESSDTADYGFIIRTSPEPGEVVRVNTEVILYVSRGFAPGAYKTPDLTGMDELTTYASIIQASLRVGKVTYAPSDSIARGRVLSQSPAPGDMVAINTPVDVVLCSGPEGIQMPDVIGIQYELAQETLTRSYMITNIRIEWAFDQEVPAEMVIRTEPDQTGRVFENTEVVLYVSLGPSIVLDDYVGMPSGEVISLLSALGPTVTERYEQSEIFPYGVVLSTEPAAGTEISTSSEVIVVISQGTAVTMEDYTGRDISEVRALLEDKGLVVAVEYVMTNSVSPGTVLGMDREVGELVPGGSTVRFSVAEEDTRILLDDWVGRPASEAKAELEELGLSVELSYVTSDTSPEGVVIQMNPSGGEYADPGSLVVLVVSSGSAPVTSEPETTEPETTEPETTEPETTEPETTEPETTEPETTEPSETEPETEEP
ncbi:MAG: PASTA domain-containing protein, partial [Clostridia bacterium]|nr:PASTA domain-containing protein [Clostridia bacterium]